MQTEPQSFTFEILALADWYDRLVDGVIQREAVQSPEICRLMAVDPKRQAGIFLLLGIDASEASALEELLGNPREGKPRAATSANRDLLEQHLTNLLERGGGRSGWSLVEVDLLKNEVVKQSTLHKLELSCRVDLSECYSESQFHRWRALM